MPSKLNRMVVDLAEHYGEVTEENVHRLQTDLETCLAWLQSFTQDGLDRCELNWECGIKPYPTHRKQAPVEDCRCGVCRVVRWDREEIP